MDKSFFKLLNSLTVAKQNGKFNPSLHYKLETQNWY